MSRDGGSGCLAQIIGIGLLLAIEGIVSMCQNTQSRLIKDAREKNRIGYYETYLEKYPNGRYATEAYDAIVKLWDEIEFRDFQKIPLTVGDDDRYYKSAIITYNDLIAEHSDPTFRAKLQNKMESKCRAQYDNALQLNTLDGWAHYLTHAPDGFKFDAQDRYDVLHSEKWGTEQNAWTYACEMNTAQVYEEYESLYPNGKHFKAAEKRAVRLRVDNIFGSNHGSLPAMNKTGYGQGSSSTVIVENATSYVLTVYYSGTDGKRLIIQPHGRQSVVLINGQYRIAASVSDKSVRSFAGSETLTGGEYNVKYYIQTTKY